MNLNELFKSVAQGFDLKFDKLSREVSHPLKSGEARENALREILEEYLPKRVGIDSGFVIDTQGQESKQIDVVVYDKTNATVFDISGIKYFPCEIVIAVGEVKSDVNSKEDLEDALNKIKSVKELDRSNQRKNLMITGPGISLSSIKFDPLTQYRDQIFGFIFTSSSMSGESVIEILQEYNSKFKQYLWLNLFCAYEKFLISYESDEGLTPNPMNAKRMYSTTEDETPNLLLLFILILSTFINESHVARPNYFHYANINTTMHIDYPLKKEEKP